MGGTTIVERRRARYWTLVLLQLADENRGQSPISFSVRCAGNRALTPIFTIFLAHRDGDHVVAAQDVELNAAPSLQRRGQLLDRGHTLSVDADDEVAGTQTLAVGGRFRLDAGHLDGAVAPGKSAFRDLLEHGAGELLHGLATGRDRLDGTDLRLHGPLFAAALYLELDGLADRHDRKSRAQLGCPAHRPAVQPDHHVAFAQTGVESGRIGLHLGDGSTFAADDVGHADPEAAALDLAELDELLHHRVRNHDRHGEADADVAARRTDDCAVDADELAPQVYQRPAGVPGIDRGIGLDEVLEALHGQPAAAERGDDA